MYRYISLLRDRFTLRINEDGGEFFYHNEMLRRWDTIRDQTMASRSAVVRGAFNGQKIHFSSRFQVEQHVIVVHMGTQLAVGSIMISSDGAITVASKPNFRFLGTLPDFWLHRTTVVLGVKGACTINIRDVYVEDEDIIRLKVGEERWFIPARYSTSTAGYDTQTGENETAVQRVRVLKTGERATMLIQSEVLPTSSTRPTTPVPKTERADEHDDDEAAGGSTMDTESVYNDAQSSG